MHAPNPDLAALSRLVGTWQLAGDARGTISYAWMDGGFFLLQRVDFEHDGRTIRGLEVIGHEKPFGGEPGDDIRSRFYDNAGNTLTGGWTWPGGGYETVATRTG